MKTLKSIVEGILGDLDNDLDDITLSYEFANHEKTAQNHGWGTSNTKYDIKGDILNINYKYLTWVCDDNKFWDLIKENGIKYIKCNAPMIFRDISFNLDKISIDAPEGLSIINCNANLKNCEIICGGWRAQNNQTLNLNKVNIKCTDSTQSCLADFCINNLNYKNLSVESKIIDIRQHKQFQSLKETDWGKYIESLGAIKILPSGRGKVLNENLELDEDFAPIWGTANTYNIYLDCQTQKFTFIKDELVNTLKSRYSQKQIKSIVHFKNGWTGIYLIGQ